MNSLLQEMFKKKLGDHVVRAHMLATYFLKPKIAFYMGRFLVSGGGRRKTIFLGCKMSARHLLGVPEEESSPGPHLPFQL